MTGINDNTETMLQIEKFNPELFYRINYLQQKSTNIFNAPILDQISPRNKNDAKKWSSTLQTKKPQTKFDLGNNQNLMETLSKKVNSRNRLKNPSVLQTAPDFLKTMLQSKIVSMLEAVGAD